MTILSTNLSTHEFLAPVQTAQLDFFDLMPERLTTQKGVIVLNPPYGRRLEHLRDTAAFTGKSPENWQRTFTAGGWGSFFQADSSAI